MSLCGNFKKILSLVSVISAIKDLFVERVRREVIPTKVQVTEERQVLEGPAKEGTTILITKFNKCHGLINCCTITVCW